MKVCIISNDFSMQPVGGRAVSLKRIVSGMIKKYEGTEFHIITRKGESKFQKSNGIFVYKLDHFRENAIGMIKRLDERLNFDIIHGFDLYPDGLIAVNASSLLNKPSIVGLRTSYISLSLSNICKIVAKKAGYVVSVSKQHLKLFTKITRRKTRTAVINNSIQIPQNRKGRKNSKTFIIGNVSYLGDVRKVKGWGYLLDAFKVFASKVPDSRLVLIGASKTDNSNFLKAVEKNSIKHRIVVKGVMKHEDVLREMQMFDVYVQSSISEGFPNAVLEAMSFGIPVIATRVGGTKEIVKHGYNGLLIEPFSSEEIYERLIEIYNNREKMYSLGQNGYMTVKRHFNPEREIREWYEVYKKVLKL